jgi:hypothetical protein
MSKNKKLSKEEQMAETKALDDRKARDKALGYKYSPCSFCGKAVRWRLPVGMPDSEEAIKKYEPKHCGEDECGKMFAEQEMGKRHGKSM